MTADRRAIELNFSWLEPDRVAGSRGPRSRDDLLNLAGIGILAIVRLASEGETGLTTVDLERLGLDDCYEPVTD
jgi:atypical dual specificity phosphatase